MGTKNNLAIWLCRCDCGLETIVRGALLRSGKTKSCSCFRKELLIEYNRTNGADYTGYKYNRLVVINESCAKNGCRQWICRCDCGAEVIVADNNLRTGNTKSCGCLVRDSAIVRGSKHRGVDSPRYIHGKRCGFGTKEQKEFHERIRQRDNYTCQKCGKTQEEELSTMGQSLSVHHKDRDHFNNTDKNAQTLCHSCHIKIEAKLTRIDKDAELLGMLDRTDAGEYSTLLNEVIECM